MEPTQSISADINYKREALFSLLYFTLYFFYLFYNQESEFLHWLTLVVIPLILLIVHQCYFYKLPFKTTLESVGLKKNNKRKGILAALIIGLLLSALQLLLSRKSGEILQIISSGKVFLLFPLVFLLMVLTAGFTEEFFFRGILQTRLTAYLKSKYWSVAITSLLFGIYHLPYAYLHPNWPSHGNLLDAFGASLGQAVPMGIILGILYERTNNNLIACIIVHALTNTLPAMTLIKISF